MNLPSHNRLMQYFPDAMHTVKDAIERVFFLLIGKTNLDKILASEIAYGRFSLKYIKVLPAWDVKGTPTTYIISVSGCTVKDSV